MNKSILDSKNIDNKLQMTKKSVHFDAN